MLLDWSNGASSLFDIRKLAEDALSPDLDDPILFSQVRIASHGESIEWPGGQDLAPETLYELSEPASDGVAAIANIANAGGAESAAMLSVRLAPDGIATTVWSNGETRIFDCWAHAEDRIDALADPTYVAQGKLDRVSNCIAWPNGETFGGNYVLTKSALAHPACN